MQLGEQHNALKVVEGLYGVIVNGISASNNMALGIELHLKLYMSLSEDYQHSRDYSKTYVELDLEQRRACRHCGLNPGKLAKPMEHQQEYHMYCHACDIKFESVDELQVHLRDERFDELVEVDCSMFAHKLRKNSTYNNHAINITKPSDETDENGLEDHNLKKKHAVIQSLMGPRRSRLSSGCIVL